MMDFCCPACKSPVTLRGADYRCLSCSRTFPIVCEIPDFRLQPDPYIGIEEDRQKGRALAEAGRTRSFEELVRYYYSITPEDPSDLAEQWIAHALSEVKLAKLNLSQASKSGVDLLDIGCSTGAMPVAASAGRRSVTGVDVAFRWLVIGQCRIRELGISAELVCANAEALPFADSTFDQITATDVLEHVRNPAAALNESWRVSLPGAQSLLLTNNRYAPVPDPQVSLWGVGLLPREWQARYVARRRKDLHPYRVSMLSYCELRRLCIQAGYRLATTGAAALYAPHLPNTGLQLLLKGYNRAREMPIIEALLRQVGPKLLVLAEK